MSTTGGCHGRWSAVGALRAAVSDLDGRLGTLMDEAVDHFAEVIHHRPLEAVAAVAVPVAIFGCLRRDPVPNGLLACAAATYLAFDILDDQMDGDETTFWRGRRENEVVIGAQTLLLTASNAIADGAPPRAATRMPLLYRAMIAEVAEGQLSTEQPLSEATTPAAVAAAISARSGAMLAGFAVMAAVAADATEPVVEAARTFGHELAVARQHLNDITELVGDRTTDLRNRTATMAAALALQSLAPDRRGTLIDSMRAAATDDDARRRLVLDDLTPAIAEVGVLIQLHLGRARMEARFLSRDGIGQDGLDRLIEFTAAPLRSNNVH